MKLCQLQYPLQKSRNQDPSHQNSSGTFVWLMHQRLSYRKYPRSNLLMIAQSVSAVFEQNIIGGRFTSPISKLSRRFNTFILTFLVHTFCPWERGNGLSPSYVI